MSRCVLSLADGRRLDAKPSGSVAHVAACPACSAAPGVVRGTGISHHNHTTYFAPAIAQCCGAKVGTLELIMDTMFGINEDEAVLTNGRARVYP